MIRLIYPAMMTALLFAAGVNAQEDEQGRAEKFNPSNSRELIRQWVQTERIISEEKTSWQVEKQRMDDLLSIYQKELKLLDEELAQAGAGAGLVDENKEKLEAGLAKYHDARQLLRDVMARLLPRMQALVARFPDPLLEELDVDMQVLNDAAALEKPRDVLKAMISVLNGAGRFNRTITVAEENRVINGDKKITVDVLYLGLGRAFYTTASGQTAGIGTPSATGWSWAEKPEIAEAVRRTISVYRKSEQPQVVELPVQLQTGEEEQ